MTTLAVVHAAARAALRDAGIDDAELDARLLVQHAFSLSREELFLNRDQIAEEEGRVRLQEYVQRRLQHEPVSRIAGVRSFWKFDFKIVPQTLDPRQDSEILIEKGVKLAIFMPETPLFLDLGTGSGCLLLSLLQEIPKSRGIGVDIDDKAVKTAQKNAFNLSLQDRAEFIVSDWKNLQIDQKCDLILSNPPYITDAEMLYLAPEVANYDPAIALRGGADGLDCYRNIIALLPRLLKEEGFVVFEIGYQQAAAVSELLANAGFSVLETAQDLAGNDRCLVATAAKGKVKAL